MATTLADHLRALPNDALAALLQLRPDLVVPVPADLSSLAVRAQSRVSVARAFVNRPPIMLCDEPTGNLDPKTSVEIMRLLDRINRTGTTIVMATHDHAIVDAMKRRVVALENGRITRDEVAGRYERAAEEE